MSRLVTFICAFIVLCFALLPLKAQEQQPPDYRISIIRGMITPDGEHVEVEFGITNIGGTAREEAVVQLVAVNPTGMEVIDTLVVRALQGNNDREFFLFHVPVTRFAPGAQQQFRVALDDETAIGSQPAAFSVGIPVYEMPKPPIERFLSQLPIDFNNQRDMMLLAAIIAVGTIIFWLLTVLLRQVLSKPPQFGTWQPPYATLPPLDINSTYGRRQLWQQHAQNNVITTACTQGALHGTKTLIGVDGRYLSGWRITAIRLSQYDMYGRVSRSVVLAPSSVVRKLDRAAQKSGVLEREKLQRRMRPVAKMLAKLVLKRMTPRSAILPVALDVRFQGIHGEVSILFNVYQCINGYWQQIESWHPDMMVMTKTMYESYTYTVFGQTGGESFKDFKKRLPDDLTHVLTELIGPRPFVPEAMMIAPQRESPPTSPNMAVVDVQQQVVEK